MPECEKSNIAYLRVFNEPADDKDTIIRVLNFLYKVYEADKKKIKYLVVVGDGKTYKHLRKLKYEYGSELEWLIPFPGDWYTCKTFQKILTKIY